MAFTHIPTHRAHRAPDLNTVFWLRLCFTLHIVAGSIGVPIFATCTPPEGSIRIASPEFSRPSAAPEGKEVFGYSVQGRPLIAHVFGQGPGAILFLGGIHGNEPAPPRVLDQLREYLETHLSEYEGRQVVLAPRLNPDGLQRGSRTNAHGVDLNRNFPAGWRPRRPGHLSPGYSAASEPETRALIRLVKQYHPSVIISIHQPLRCLLGTGEQGEILARQMQRPLGYPVRKGVGYPTPGAFGEYCARVLHIPAVVTLELPHGSAAALWHHSRIALLASIHFDPTLPARNPIEWNPSQP